MRRYGFKLFSTNWQANPALVNDLTAFLREHREESFFELMVVPSTPVEDLSAMRDLFAGLEVTIHAPHGNMNFEPGSREKFAENARLFGEAQRAADLFEAKVIVVHPGFGDLPENLEESARQLRLLNDSRIAVENLPYKDEDADYVMHGNTAAQIKQIMDYVGCGFCFDFSHAICAANSLGLDLEKQLAGFYNLKPTVYHMCDGNINGTEDKHLHYGEGNFPLKSFLQNYVAPDAMITMETGMGIPKDASEIIKDFNYLRQL